MFITDLHFGWIKKPSFIINGNNKIKNKSFHLTITLSNQTMIHVTWASHKKDKLS